jgi:hypothetical protein
MIQKNKNRDGIKSRFFWFLFTNDHHQHSMRWHTALNSLLSVIKFFGAIHNVLWCDHLYPGYSSLGLLFEICLIC